jgi:hypothetical protein
VKERRRTRAVNRKWFPSLCYLTAGISRIISPQVRSASSRVDIGIATSGADGKRPGRLETDRFGRAHCALDLATPSRNRGVDHAVPREQFFICRRATPKRTAASAGGLGRDTETAFSSADYFLLHRSAHLFSAESRTQDTQQHKHPMDDFGPAQCAALLSNPF